MSELPASNPRERDQLDLGSAPEATGGGCSSKDTMLDAARKAGKSDILDQYAADYPVDPERGPHDQPQSMCPAFGSLRV
ncbi:MAG: chlorophyllide reductase subunit Y, partial [Pseudomonadota bacterium]